MYVGACLDRFTDKVLIAERLPNGKRVTNSVKPIYEFYVEDPDGDYDGYDGKFVKKIQCENSRDFWSMKRKFDGQRTYEMNFNIVQKCLYKYYKNAELPILHKSYMDIEVDLTSRPGIQINDLILEACCPINAISIYNNWEQTLQTFTLKPPSISDDEAKQIISEFDNTILCENEQELLARIIIAFEDADVITGWNSNGFDIPYIIRRIEKVLGEGESKRICLWDKEPIAREYNEYGKDKVEYTLIGKWSADYLLLYKKHTQGEHDSYKLDNIAYEELGERKVAYEGTLDELYYNDYKKFLDYNRQDTMLIVRLDDKLNYINIHNKQAHQIPCLFETTMGTVGWFDQMVINKAHENNKVVPDKENKMNPMFIDVKAPGAFVQDPTIGLQEWIGCTDLNSLYPSTIRCLNMSPETFVAQIQLNETIPYLRRKAEENNLWKKKSEGIIDWGAAWGGDELFGTLEYQHIMKQTDDIVELVFANGTRVHKTAKEIYDIVFNDNSNLCISAFGTIFRTDKQGLVAGILSDWYAERKAYKKRKYEYECLGNGLSISNELAELLK